jgi:hypothetical protein
MPIEPEGWYVDAGPPSWDADAKTFSFFCVSRVVTECCAFSPLMRWRTPESNDDFCPRLREQACGRRTQAFAAACYLRGTRSWRVRCPEGERAP